MHPVIYLPVPVDWETKPMAQVVHEYNQRAKIGYNNAKRLERIIQSNITNKVLYGMGIR